MKKDNKKVSLFFTTLSAALLMFGNTVSSPVQAQLLKEIGQRIKNRSKEKLLQKADETVDGGIEVLANKGSTSKNSTPVFSPPEQKEGKNLYKTKFDFIPGEKMLWLDDFAADAIGDFPAGWNTTGTGELVTVPAKEGKWLMLSKDGVLLPKGAGNLPENFTLQFDLLCNSRFSYYSTDFSIYFASLSNKKEYFLLQQYHPHNKDAVRFWVHPNNAANTSGFTGYELISKGTKQTKNETNTPQFFSLHHPGFTKVSMWRQKGRLRVYLNEEKIWDLPQAFEEGTDFNSLLFCLGASRVPTDQYFVSNFRLAAGAPDVRSQLTKEGRFTTHGILFDVGSDAIKPESYGVLKDITGALKENEGIYIKIIGHTDSDGSEEENLALSKRRAEAVKKLLVNEYGITATRLQADGKGEKEPVDKANTATGKANNRRVEFVKL